MQRYVALIATSDNQSSFDQLAHRLARRFADWRCALDERRAKAWVMASSPSPIGFTSHGPSGCLIGVELGDRQPAPWDGKAGRGLLSRSWGAYVSIEIGEGPIVTITRDPCGRIACWTSRLSCADLYFSHIDDVPEAEAASGDAIDWDFIEYHLNFYGGTHGRCTGLKAVAELLPGRQVRYSGGPGRESSAWPIADIIESRFESPAAAEAGLRAATAEAVRGWAQQYDDILVNLSGGFDSAVILGLIREQAPDTNIVGINYLIPHPEGDERAYAQAAADHNGVPLLVEPAPVGKGRIDLNIARHWLRPSFALSPTGSPETRARAANTISAPATFSGTGGDQVFCENLRPSMLAEAVQHRLHLPELLSLAHDYAKMTSDTFWNIAWATLKELYGPARGAKATLQTPNSYLTCDGIDAANFERFVHPDVLELGERVSSAKLRQIVSFHGRNACRCRDDPEFNYLQVNPLWSQGVMEASLRIPTYWMNPAGRRRGLARRAFRDIVPPTILARRGKGSTTSHTLQTLANNAASLRDLILDGQLVRRGIVDKKKLENNLSSKAFLTKDQFAGLGEIIVTELWVQFYASHFSNLASSTINESLIDFGV